MIFLIANNISVGVQNFDLVIGDVGGTQKILSQSSTLRELGIKTGVSILANRRITIFSGHFSFTKKKKTNDLATN
jgi:hypothetical protein